MSLASALAQAGKTGLEIPATSKYYSEAHAALRAGRAVKAHGIYYSRDAAYSILWDCFLQASRLWTDAGCPSGPLEVAFYETWAAYHAAEPKLP